MLSTIHMFSVNEINYFLHYNTLLSFSKLINPIQNDYHFISATEMLLSHMLSTINMFSVNEINYFSILLIQLQSVVYSVCIFLSTEIQI